MQRPEAMFNTAIKKNETVDDNMLSLSLKRSKESSHLQDLLLVPPTCSRSDH